MSMQAIPGAQKPPTPTRVVIPKLPRIWVKLIKNGPPELSGSTSVCVPPSTRQILPPDVKVRRPIIPKLL
jgi:hypothetical protein